MRQALLSWLSRTAHDSLPERNQTNLGVDRNLLQFSPVSSFWEYRVPEKSACLMSYPLNKDRKARFWFSTSSSCVIISGKWWGHQKYLGTNAWDSSWSSSLLPVELFQSLLFQWIHSLQLTRIVLDRYLGWATVSCRKDQAEPGREVQDGPPGTVGHCDIISDGPDGFPLLALQSQLLLQSPFLYHECGAAKINRFTCTLRWQTGSGKYSHFPI